MSKITKIVQFRTVATCRTVWKTMLTRLFRDMRVYYTPSPSRNSKGHLCVQPSRNAFDINSAPDNSDAETHNCGYKVYNVHARVVFAGSHVWMEFVVDARQRLKLDFSSMPNVNNTRHRAFGAINEIFIFFSLYSFRSAELPTLCGWFFLSNKCVMIYESFTNNESTRYY